MIINMNPIYYFTIHNHLQFKCVCNRSICIHLICATIQVAGITKRYRMVQSNQRHLVTAHNMMFPGLKIVENSSLLVDLVGNLYLNVTTVVTSTVQRITRKWRYAMSLMLAMSVCRCVRVWIQISQSEHSSCHKMWVLCTHTHTHTYLIE